MLALHASAHIMNSVTAADLAADTVDGIGLPAGLASYLQQLIQFANSATAASSQVLIHATPLNTYH